MKKLRILFSCSAVGANFPMGGPRANAYLVDALRNHWMVEEVAVTDKEVAKTGYDVLIVEAPTGLPFVQACAPKFTFVLRHGDTPIGDCAYELFEQVEETRNAALLVPSKHAARGLPRVPYYVQHMALAPLVDVRPRGTKVLHMRAFDFMKDTYLAVDVARCASDLSFVFRLDRPGAVWGDALSNVILLPPTVEEDELWDNVGCLLVTSRDETFCMGAYEAMTRGIQVVAHASLGALREWGHGCFFATSVDGLAAACREALQLDAKQRATVHGVSERAHRVAHEQIESWLRHAYDRVTA